MLRLSGYQVVLMVVYLEVPNLKLTSKVLGNKNMVVFYLGMLKLKIKIRKENSSTIVELHFS